MWYTAPLLLFLYNSNPTLANPTKIAYIFCAILSLDYCLITMLRLAERPWDFIMNFAKKRISCSRSTTPTAASTAPTTLFLFNNYNGTVRAPRHYCPSWTTIRMKFAHFRYVSHTSGLVLQLSTVLLCKFSRVACPKYTSKEGLAKPSRKSQGIYTFCRLKRFCCLLYHNVKRGSITLANVLVMVHSSWLSYTLCCNANHNPPCGELFQHDETAFRSIYPMCVHRLIGLFASWQRQTSTQVFALLTRSIYCLHIGQPNLCDDRSIGQNSYK